MSCTLLFCNGLSAEALITSKQFVPSFLSFVIHFTQVKFTAILLTLILIIVCPEVQDAPRSPDKQLCSLIPLKKIVHNEKNSLYFHLEFENLNMKVHAIKCKTNKIHLITAYYYNFT